MSDWLTALRGLNEESVFVQHNPPTPRYGRAAAKLEHIIHRSVLLGSRRHDLSTATEIALWTPPTPGSRTGLYACFRLYLDEFEMPDTALLFCFYDGTGGSPAFRSRLAAAAYALDQGFTVTHEDD